MDGDGELESSALPLPEEIRSRWPQICSAVEDLGGWFMSHTGGLEVRDGFPREAPAGRVHCYRLPHQVKVGDHWQDVETDVVGYCVGSFLFFRVARSDPWFPQLGLMTMENEKSIDDGDAVIQVVLL